MRRWFIILFLGAFLLSACGEVTGTKQGIKGDLVSEGAELGYVPVFKKDDCPFELVFKRKVQCGYLLVPEDRSKPKNGRVVRLAVAIFKSESPNPAPAPLVFVNGGPGGNTLEALPYNFEDKFSEFVKDRDLILYDQRGTGYSEPLLDCPEYVDVIYETLEGNLADESRLELLAAALQECRSRLEDEGVDFTHYNSVESAADLRDLRLVLGFKEWNLLGVSYGTRLSLSVMRYHPEGIRSVILDSVYPPEVSLVIEAPANMLRSFEWLFEVCASDTACSQAYPNLKNVLSTTVQNLNTTPVVVPVVDVLTGTQYDAYINGKTLLGVVFQSLYSVDATTSLPKLIYDVYTGDYNLFGRYISAYLSNNQFISIGMHYSVRCHEEISFNKPEDIEQSTRELSQAADEILEGVGTGKNIFTVCDLWEAGGADPIENQPVHSEIPTLLLAGEFDPVTPPAWAWSAHESLSNAYIYEFPSLGHGVVFLHSCPQSVALDFLDDPNSAPDGSCIQKMTTLEFELPADGEVLRFVPVKIGDIGVTSIVPLGWVAYGESSYYSSENSINLSFHRSDGDLHTFIEENDLSGPVKELSFGDRGWTLYTFDSDMPGNIGLISIFVAEADVFAVSLIGPEGKRYLMENIVLPKVLGAFEMLED
jgi:pimeloyl-ACP methyl ester carboxylesterase